MQKKFEELTFTDNFIFCRVLSSRPDLAKQLIEMILDTKIDSIELVDSEKTMKMSPESKGSRLDVFIKTCDGRFIDLEMQTSVHRDLPKRMRYYQDIADINCLEQGHTYDELNEHIVIFIVLSDPIRPAKGLWKYTFVNRCIESPDTELGDMTKKIIVNANGDISKAGNDIQALMKYLKEGVAMSDFTKSLDNAVGTARDNPALKLEYMSWNASMVDARNDGRLEGRAEGRAEGELYGILANAQQVFDNCISRGMSEEDAYAISGLKEAMDNMNHSG